jgi:hypothetical protein
MGDVLLMAGGVALVGDTPERMAAAVAATARHATEFLAGHGVPVEKVTWQMFYRSPVMSVLGASFDRDLYDGPFARIEHDVKAGV